MHRTQGRTSLFFEDFLSPVRVESTNVWVHDRFTYNFSFYYYKNVKRANICGKTLRGTHLKRFGPV